MWGWGALAVALLLLLGACRPVAPAMPGRTELGVASVRFEGLQSFDEEELLEVLATQEDAYNPFTPPSRYSPYDVATDVQRVEAFLHARGYFDAKVSDFEVTERKDEPAVDVRFTVEEGLPSLISEVQFDRRSVGQVDLRVLLAGLPVERGRRFSEEELARTAQIIRTRLQENGYAYARVESRSFVHRERHEVQVYFFWDRGPACVFGRLEVEGNSRIPDALVAQSIQIRRGEVFRQSLLRDAQFDLYRLSVFGLVEVEAVLPETDISALDESVWAEVSRQHPGDLWAEVRVQSRPVAAPVEVAAGEGLKLRAMDPNVVVRVRVTESAAATLKFGLGAGVETGRTETYTKGAALWRGVLAPLNRVDVEGRLGYAWLANGFSLLGLSTEKLDAVEAQNDLIGSVKTALVTPQLAGSLYDISTSVRFDAGIEPGYAYRNPGAEISVSRQFGRWLRADLGYAVDVFFIPDDKLDGASGSSSLELPAQFSLGAVTWALRRDRRDDPLATRSGYLAQVEGKVSESVLVGDTSYLRMTPEFRYFRPLHRRLVLAARAKAGLLVELGGADVPRTERYYLGGGDSVRGFPQGRLGPNDYAEPSSVTAVTGAAVSYDPSCLSRPTVSERCSAVPVGGYASWLGNVELRGEIGKRWLYGTLFVDGGGVGRGSSDFALAPDDEGTQWAIGSGLRLATPIGPLRFDLGYRLTDPASYAPLDRVSIFMAFGEAF